MAAIDHDHLHLNQIKLVLEAAAQVIVMAVIAFWRQPEAGDHRVFRYSCKLFLNATKKKNGVLCITCESQKIHWPLCESHLGAKI